MKADLGASFRIAGLVRTPDREGALAHLDPDRGFAFVARGATGENDVIDPTIWVKEKISLALLSGSSPEEPPLGRVLGAIRALHAELMSRPETDRPWVSLLIVLLQGEDAVAISAGDCPCFRYRTGLLSQLGRMEPGSPLQVPRRALGSEPQVRVEVVPLRPLPGDVYVLSTRALREGELAVLARDLAAARDGAALLRAGVEGASDRGRLAVRVLEGAETEAIAATADLAGPVGSRGHEDEESLIGPSSAATGWPTELGIEDLEPARPEEPTVAETIAAGITVESLPLPVESLTHVEATSVEAAESAPVSHASAAQAGPEAPAESASSPPSDTKRPAALASVEEDRPWYEPLALWAGGALAIVALALLVRSLLTGFAPNGSQGSHAVAPVPTTGLADIFSDPPGATVRVDGVALDGKTPLTAVSLGAGVHRIDLDWGAYGSWRDTLHVASGARLTVHPALYGSVTFRSSEPSRVLDVYLDGVYAGATPLTMDKVVVGRHLVRFGGGADASNAREVEVVRDQSSEVVGNAGPVPATGSLTVKSSILGDSGFDPGKGDPFWVDGTLRGVTPATLSLSPGTHSVRVARRGFPPQITILDINAGGQHFVTGEFGASSQQPLLYQPPESFSIANPTPLTISLPENEWEPDMTVWLYAAPPGGSFQAKRMTRIEDASRTYATLLPSEVLQNTGHKVRFYFKAMMAGGREIDSEIYTVPLKD